MTKKMDKRIQIIVDDGNDNCFLVRLLQDLRHPGLNIKTRDVYHQTRVRTCCLFSLLLEATIISYLYKLLSFGVC